MKRVLLFMLSMMLCPATWAEQAVDRDNVVILLDGSGSMADKMGSQVKMDAAKQAIVEVLKTVPESTQVGLLAFSRGTRRDGWVYPLGARDDPALLQALEPVRAGGGTPLGEFIKIAADRLMEQREAQLGYGSYRLVVVTDGQATDTGKMRRFAPEVVSRGIVMDVIGVDMRQDHQLATLAHSYRTADDADSLQTALREVLGELSGGGTDTAGEEAFAVIQGLPDGIAATVLASLAVGNNSAIGENPAFEARDSQQHHDHAASPSSAQDTHS